MTTHFVSGTHTPH